MNRPDSGPVPFEDLRRMIAMLGHRGPDGYGLYRDDRVGLAHARLSIIDLARGFQPIHNEDETIWLSFNGEIFNYIELRRELAGLGHRFYTDGDSEVIVHAYEHYGSRAWTMFNGQFAFALWDARQELLWLVRDRVGILPLHYARAGKRVLFGSEAKALFACADLDPEIDPDGLAEVFTRWSATPPTTVFAGVRTVRPGTAVCIDRDLAERTQRYWEPDFTEHASLRDLTLDEAADRLGERLSDAVGLRLRADVPVGAYLSGGLDSSVIGSLVRTLDRSPLQTFAVRFADPRFDETAEQRRVARDPTGPRGRRLALRGAAPAHCAGAPVPAVGTGAHVGHEGGAHG
jgi:asparagine synthase (glutamine-hydrolysing)